MIQRSYLILLLSCLSSGRAFTPHPFVQDQKALLLSTKLRDSNNSTSAQDALKRSASHLDRLNKRVKALSSTSVQSGTSGVNADREALYQSYIQRPADSLKEELKSLKLPRNGRKPDLAKRLADYQIQQRHGIILEEESKLVEQELESVWGEEADSLPPVKRFAGLNLSKAAGKALGNAKFSNPTPIQEAAIPLIANGDSGILHAETGSGKTLAYLLPVTEQLWRELDEEEGLGFCVILTPTRELAAQVAGIAQVLAPPGSVRLVFRPTNLMVDSLKEHGEDEFGGLVDRSLSRNPPRLFVGSAKAIMTSLYGDGVMPASPTSKPEAMFFLRNVRWLILDEVDRLLHVQKSRNDPRFKQHERPAAIVSAAVARMTLGGAQVVAVSATVGRPLRREMSRVLGLAPDECPPVIRGSNNDLSDISSFPREQGRVVTIPDLVQHYVTPVDGESTGKFLTTAFQVISKLNRKPQRILLVLTRGCGMSTKTAIGALKHFKCHPEPTSLLDALEADGSDRMIEIHRQVSGAGGIGETGYFQEKRPDENGRDNHVQEEYLLVTGEDTVRGLHLDSLDFVVVVGRPHGPDEYTHIAGRTGRAGKRGKVINIVSTTGASHLMSWGRMLEVDFEELEVQDIESLLK